MLCTDGYLCAWRNRNTSHADFSDPSIKRERSADGIYRYRDWLSKSGISIGKRNYQDIKDLGSDCADRDTAGRISLWKWVYGRGYQLCDPFRRFLFDRAKPWHKRTWNFFSRSCGRLGSLRAGFYRSSTPCRYCGSQIKRSKAASEKFLSYQGRGCGISGKWYYGRNLLSAQFGIYTQ